MSDNKNIKDGRDRSKVSATDDHEVSYLAKKFDVSTDDVLEAIAEAGSNRDDVEAHLERRKQKSGR
jgi:hypothetical protein